ncbi:MAG: phage recombination protein Bet [Clostridium sp.]
MASDLMTKECTFLVNNEEVKLTGSTVKNYLTRGNDEVNDQEVVMFINLCKYQKLNPFLNEAYLVKFKGSPAQIITSKEAYMKKAERNSDFEGFRAGLIVQRNGEIKELEGCFCLKNDVLLGGWAEVYKKGRKNPYVSKITLEEYNKGQSTWNKMPKTMIRKTAIVQALREAFPEDLGALYIEEEQNGPINVESTSKTVKEEVAEKANKEIIDIDTTEVEVVSDKKTGGPSF